MQTLPSQAFIAEKTTFSMLTLDVDEYMGTMPHIKQVRPCVGHACMLGDLHVTHKYRSA